MALVLAAGAAFAGDPPDPKKANNGNGEAKLTLVYKINDIFDAHYGFEIQEPGGKTWTPGSKFDVGENYGMIKAGSKNFHFLDASYCNCSVDQVVTVTFQDPTPWHGENTRCNGQDGNVKLESLKAYSVPNYIRAKIIDGKLQLTYVAAHCNKPGSAFTDNRGDNDHKTVASFTIRWENENNLPADTYQSTMTVEFATDASSSGEEPAGNTPAP